MIRRDWKILLVDDDPDDHVLIRDIVRALGCDLDWADRYDAGLERIGRQPYDVCLVDYRMGERDGLEFIRDGLARGCPAPMILLTGQGDLLIDMKAMQAGAVDYLEKGQVDPAILERSIRYAIDRKQTEAVLANRARELAYANATLRELADVATGGLKEPLKTILAVLRDLRGRPGARPDPEAEAMLDRAMDAAERMRDRVKELTVLSGAAADEVDGRLPGE